LLCTVTSSAVENLGTRIDLDCAYISARQAPTKKALETRPFLPYRSGTPI